MNQIVEYRGTDALAKIVGCSRRSVQFAVKSGLVHPDAFYIDRNGKRHAAFTESTLVAMSQKLKGTV